MVNYVLAINLIALGASYVKPVKMHIQSWLKRMWFYSLLTIFPAATLSMIFQALSLSTINQVNFTITELSIYGMTLFILCLSTTYFCIPLYHYDSLHRKHALIGFQLNPILSALNQELDAYQQQLKPYKNSSQPEIQDQLIRSLEEKLSTSKLPLYADSTEVSMALYPILSKEATKNTWLEVALFPLSPTDLACLMTLVCDYLTAYHPGLILGIQLTPLTKGDLYIKIQSNVFAMKHLKAFIRWQKLITPEGPIQNHHINRICLRELLIQNDICIKHHINEDASEVLVFSARR